ncbi:MAG: hypothetical protein EPGJADBJ_04895 [Saprospiraceae bacterium]|nr:hypothetical protein [Saprospiraceae bacterium]
MKKYCQNCYHPLTYKAKFCAHCGQKATDGKIPVSDLMQQLWFRVLHLESRSFRVLWRLFIPGQVSLDYFSGKRKRYPPPVQFFFVIMFFFLLLVNHLIGDTGHIGFRESEEGFRIASNDTITPPADLYRLGQRYAQIQRLRYTFDSLPPEYRTPEVRAALDSLFRRTGDGGSQALGAIFSADRDSLAIRPPDSLSFSLGIRHLKVSVMDLFEHDADYLIQKYQLTHWADKMLMRQGIKSVKEPKTLIKTYIGSLAWTLLVLVALMAGVLTLLYIRQGRYYVEHFIFLLHEHTAIFLLLTLTMLLANITRLDPYIWGLVLCWLLIAPVLAMKRFYRQNWQLTMLKSTIFSVVYAIGFLFLFIGGIVVVFILF